ncbi:hypothetical protein BG011_005461 [Mortierella polycephala]|uniref:Uncharacterized protein n=1 Tax=Mortierella polycephala TaxID=41804 RepID=A0A9P6U0W4_9FUNG|nr:hypothetical protein BG011_005461 [Mortierella polycephala]
MFSLACHAVYSLNLANFPYINLVSVPFLASCGNANDNALPSFDKTQDNSQKKNGILKGLFGAILNKKDTLPVLVEAPKYTGFGNSLGPSTGAPSSFNSDARPDYLISRSSSSNSNHGHGFQSTQGSNYGSQQQYASSSSVYSHTGSTVGSRF